MHIDKEGIAKYLINAGIRNVFSGECPIANNVIVGAARGLLGEYAKTKGISLSTDLNRIVAKEYRVKLFKLMNERYDFFRHSDRNADQEIDLHNVQVTNEVTLCLNIWDFEQIFGHATEHMRFFLPYLKVLNPSLFPGCEEAKALKALKGPTPVTRKELCEIGLLALRDDPGCQKELQDVQDISYAEETRGGVRIDLRKGPPFMARTRKPKE